MTALDDFIAQAPIERSLILAVVREAAAAAPAGARVLDAGAGDAPYRELFAHTDYKTTDWTESPHPGARSADIIASLDALPVEDASFDVVLCTQVLEHVAEPALVLAELRRVLRDGGELWLTVPFVGELHEEPHDHYRYTSYGLQGLCERAGFGEVRTLAAGRLLHGDGAARAQHGPGDGRERRLERPRAAGAGGRLPWRGEGAPGSGSLRPAEGAADRVRRAGGGAAERRALRGGSNGRGSCKRPA